VTYRISVLDLLHIEHPQWQKLWILTRWLPNPKTSSPCLFDWHLGLVLDSEFFGCGLGWSVV
jgi:hypothetical protein